MARLSAHILNRIMPCRPLAGRARRLAAAGLACLALAGCAVNPATGERDLILLSESQEAAMGAQEHPKLLKAFGGAYDDAAIAAYVDEIGQRLVAVSEYADRQFTFTVVDSPIVNAFALPGGYVYVTRGLLALAQDEAELAGVLAHEIGHVTARHSAQRVSQSLLATLGIAVLQAATGSQAAGDVAQLGAAAYLQSYSRGQEFQADSLGVRYLSRAGYDPCAMSSFLTTLSRHSRLELKRRGREDEADKFDIFASHPRTPERVAEAVASAQARAGCGEERRRDAYLARIDGLLYGWSREQGVIRDRVFEHPVLKIAFEAPPGFTLINSDDSVDGYGPDDARFVFDMGETGPNLSTEAYLTRVWAKNVRLEGVETVTINGMEAATGRTTVSSSQGSRNLRLVAIRGSGERVYRFVIITPPSVTDRYNVDFRRMTYSFRRLSDAEAARVRALKIAVVTVGADDSVDSLVSRMALNGDADQLFRIINAIPPGGTVTPGQKVKLIVD